MQTKVCTKCGIEKELSQFHKDNSGKHKDGRRSHCKMCSAAYSASKRILHPRPPSQDKKEYQKQYHQIHKNETRVRMIPYTYGISVETYDKLLVEQGGVCAICGSNETARPAKNASDRRLSVDHNHETGKVRGLLCSRCNVGLGFFKDDYRKLQSALEYIRKWNEKEEYD